MTSVIVPAHNEEGRVGRCLTALTSGAAEGEFEIIVVPNGCTDRTVEESRTFEPAVKVIELDVASKVAALNAGDDVATSYPRVYVDADVVVTVQDLRLVVAALDDADVHLAAPQRYWIVEGRPWIVRSYLRLLRQLPQVRSSLMGGGVLAVSEQGRARFGRFPDVIGDDLFLESRFTAAEKRAVLGAQSRVDMPATVRGLVARRTRVALANLEAPSAEVSHSRWSSLGEALRDRPELAFDLPAFLGVTAIAQLAARQRLRRGDRSWIRDYSSR